MPTIGALRQHLSHHDFADQPAETYGPQQALYQQKRYTAALDRFLNVFGGTNDDEVVMLSSPGRTELGGNHTDHNNGCVLAAAVTLDCLAVARPSGESMVRLVSEGFEDRFEIDLSDLRPRESEKGRTEALIRGVAAGLAHAGITPVGAEIYLESRVAPGSGLSSSAAVEVLMGALFSRLANKTIEPVALAKIGQAAENRFFGKPCGLMDQVACAHGGIVSIDFAESQSPVVVAMDTSFSEFGYALFVVDTGGDHTDLTAEYAAIPQEMRSVARHFGKKTMRAVTREQLITSSPEVRKESGDRAFLRALHFVEENRRVADMVAALQNDDFPTYLCLVDESGRSSWQYLQNCAPAGAVTHQPVSTAVALTRTFLEQHGAPGAARVHGGGFAGTIQSYIPVELADRYIAFVETILGKSAATRIRVRKLGPSFLTSATS